MKYQKIHHCHHGPKHGKPDHDFIKGIAVCAICGWTGKLKKVK